MKRYFFLLCILAGFLNAQSGFDGVALTGGSFFMGKSNKIRIEQNKTTIYSTFGLNFAALLRYQSPITPIVKTQFDVEFRTHKIFGQQHVSAAASQLTLLDFDARLAAGPVSAGIAVGWQDIGITAVYRDHDNTTEFDNLYTYKLSRLALAPVVEVAYVSGVNCLSLQYKQAINKINQRKSD